MKLRILAPALIAAALLAGCNNDGNRGTPASTTPPAGDPGAQTALGRTVEKAMAEARRKLETGNITINGRDGGLHIGRHGIGKQDPGLPKAELTPAGDFLIDGQAVSLDARQRQLVLDYRARLMDVIGAGMAVGAKGADLGMQAAGEAMKGIFSGNMDQLEQRIEAEAKKLEADARLICQHLQPLLQAQGALAAGVPEFVPYASLEQTDIDDCMKGNGTTVFTGNAGTSKDEIRTEVRDRIRDSIRGVAQSSGLASTGTGDVVTVDGIRFLLPAGGVETETRNGETSIRVSNGLRVRLDDSGFHVNGERYPTPARGSEVDLRVGGTVRIDGKTVAAE